MYSKVPILNKIEIKMSVLGKILKYQIHIRGQCGTPAGRVAAPRRGAAGRGRKKGCRVTTLVWNQ